MIFMMNFNEFVILLAEAIGYLNRKFYEIIVENCSEENSIHKKLKN